ncbi:hypothetical protein SASPL_109257 [Salvia splendens]|uniref:Putative E3 ubiquitin-protein ligase LIN ARM-like domain-containing protein n=1 Tax=Salvia splendens TaxID=180675 RepID=A0A8X8YJN3_SALSN|nr:hypothetical protein SASPL_109257 [Salvia splendens]
MQRIIYRIHAISPTASEPESANPPARPAVMRVVHDVLAIPLETACGSAPPVCMRIQTHGRVICAPHNLFPPPQEIQGQRSTATRAAGVPRAVPPERLCSGMRCGAWFRRGSVPMPCRILLIHPHFTHNYTSILPKSTSFPLQFSYSISSQNVRRRQLRRWRLREEAEAVRDVYHQTKPKGFKFVDIWQLVKDEESGNYSSGSDTLMERFRNGIGTALQDFACRISLSFGLSTISILTIVIRDKKEIYNHFAHANTKLHRKCATAVTYVTLVDVLPDHLIILICAPTLERHNLSSVDETFSEGGAITPPAASLMIIERMVTSFDPETNSTYLAAITPPGVLSALVRAPRRDHLDEVASLAHILAKSMCFDGKCRRYISQISHTTPFVSLLSSNQERAASAALEFFNELLKTPRSSAISLLEEMRKQGSSSNLCALFLLAQNSTPEYSVLAANVLLQLEVFEDTSANSTYGEEAAEALFEALQREESPQTQALSSFILANLGGTFSWTGEAYTMAWLVRKTGLNLSQHKNLIKTYDFFDQSLQDGGVDSWCSKIAQRILQLGTRVFEALDKGLKSKIRRVARESLVATAWLGLELMKGHDELRHAACEILLHSIEQFVHPGFELEERLVACLCIYNYTSGRGMKRIMSLSEGVRESLRRLSNVTWMAEELLKVADYFQPNKWRISCVHSQILEAGTKCSAAVTALIYYKGYLCSGYADGSIKAWEVKGQTVTLVLERKEHRKAVTCLALYDPGSCLLSGSPDKTIKMWQMHQRNLECIEVIPTKESIRSIDSLGELIFVTTQNHKLKVIDGSRKARDVVKNKNVKCMRVAQGKVYAGCVDSSILEVMISNNRQQEIKGPSKGWMQSKPIRSRVSITKDWLAVDGDQREYRKMKKIKGVWMPQVRISIRDMGSTRLLGVFELIKHLNDSRSDHAVLVYHSEKNDSVKQNEQGSSAASGFFAYDNIFLCNSTLGVVKCSGPIGSR